MQSYLFTCIHLWLPNRETFTWNRATGSVALVYEVMTEFKKHVRSQILREIHKHRPFPLSNSNGSWRELVWEWRCVDEQVFACVFAVGVTPEFWSCHRPVVPIADELLRVSCLLNASISSGRVLVFREPASCQGFQLAFGGYMTFLQCSSKI